MAIFRPLSRRFPWKPEPRPDDGSSAVPFRRVVQVREAQDRRQLLARAGRAGFTGFVLDDGSSETLPQVRRIVTIRGERATRPGKAAFYGPKLDDGSSQVVRPATAIQDLSNRIRRGYVHLGQQVKDEPAPEDRVGGRVTRVQDLVSRARPGAIYWIPQILDDGSSERTHPATKVQDLTNRRRAGRIIQSQPVKDEPPPGKAGLPPELIKEVFDRAVLQKQGKVLWGAQILDDGTSETLPDVRRTKRIEDESPLSRLLPRGGRVLWGKATRPDINEPQLKRWVFRVQDLAQHHRAGMVYHLSGGAREAGVITISPGCLTLSDELVTTITLSDELATTITLSDDCQ